MHAFLNNNFFDLRHSIFIDSFAFKVLFMSLFQVFLSFPTVLIFTLMNDILDNPKCGTAPKFSKMFRHT